jgi:membrane-bound ClpP family serine protease
MLPFLIVGAIGLLLLLTSIVIGDLLDLVGAGDGLVSGIAVGAALSIFGVAGVITVSNDLPTVLTYVIAVALAVVALVAIQLFVSHIARQESGGHYSPVGLVGFTTVNTGPAGGEVRLDDVRELERRPAISETSLAAQTRIRVVEEDGYRVRVEPIVEDTPARETTDPAQTP